MTKQATDHKIPIDPEAYDEWFKQKVQDSLNDNRPKVSHNDAMARGRAKINDFILTTNPGLLIP